MNGFRFPGSSAPDGRRRRKLEVALVIAAAAALAAGVALNDGPHAAAVAAGPVPTQVAVPPASRSDPSLPVAAEVINAIAGHPDPDAPTF